MVKHADGDLSDIALLVDCDGTLARSFQGYAKVIDKMFMGTITDDRYFDYENKLDEKYNVVAGTSWRAILQDIVLYHSHPHVICCKGDRNSESPFASKTCFYDIGGYDSLVKCVYGAEPAHLFSSYDGDEKNKPIVLYESNDGSTSVALLLGDVSSDTIEDCIASMRGDNHVLVCDDCLTNSVIGAFDVDEIASSETMVSFLVSKFNALCVKMFAGMDPEHLANMPVVNLCKTVHESGGAMRVHSGSNRVILDTLLRICGVDDIVDDIVCTSMFHDMNSASSFISMGGQKYTNKDRLVMILAERARQEGRRPVVIGDTRGDAHAAQELGIPFMLVWNGNEESPATVPMDDGTVVHPIGYIDIREDRNVKEDKTKLESLIGLLAEI